MFGPAGFMKAPDTGESRQRTVRRVRYVIRNGKQFQLTFDDEAVLDTVFQVFRDKAPKQLNGSNKDVQFFVNNQTQLFNGLMAPKGVTIVNQRDMFGFNTVEAA